MNSQINYKPVFDAHCHVFPDKIAEKSRTSVGGFYGLEMYTNGTSLELERVRNNPVGDRQVVGQLICSPAVTASQTKSINEFIGNLCRENTQLVGFGTLHPENYNFDEILISIKQSGLKGVKFHSDFQQFNIDDKKMYPIYREIARQGLPVLFHMGDEKLDFSNPKRLSNVLYDIPELVCIAAHTGGYCHWEEAFSLPVKSNLYFDISSSLSFLSTNQLHDFLSKYGEDKFFFGSDFPMWNPYRELEKLDGFSLDEHTQRKIEYGNFSAFIKNI